MRAIIGMGRGLYHHIVAEGVETRDQLAFYRMQGCAAYQGYLFSKPVPVHQLQHLLRDPLSEEAAKKDGTLEKSSGELICWTFPMVGSSLELPLHGNSRRCGSGRKRISQEHRQGDQGAGSGNNGVGRYPSSSIRHVQELSILRDRNG